MACIAGVIGKWGRGGGGGEKARHRHGRIMHLDHARTIGLIASDSSSRRVIRLTPLF